MQIVFDRVSYRYPGGEDRLPALREVSFSLPQGSILAVMGRTGAGKSTLLRVLAGFAAPLSGTVSLFGEDIYASPQAKKRLRQEIGVLFQYPETQLFERTAARDAAFSLRMRRLPREEILSRVKRAMETVGLSYERVGEESPFALSGGEKRLLALAGVIAAEPSLLLLDEPFAGLDERGRAGIFTAIRNLRRTGTTVVFVSHDSDSVAELAEQVLVLEEGTLRALEPPSVLFSDRKRLEAFGLTPSVPAQLAQSLREENFPLPDGVTRYEELLSALLTLPKGGETP